MFKNIFCRNSTISAKKAIPPPHRGMKKRLSKPQRFLAYSPIRNRNRKYTRNDPVRNRVFGMRATPSSRRSMETTSKVTVPRPSPDTRVSSSGMTTCTMQEYSRTHTSPEKAASNSTLSTLRHQCLPRPRERP